MSTNKGFIRLSGVLFLVSGLFFIGTSAALGNRVLYSWLGLGGSILLMASMWGLFEFIKIDGKQGALKFGVSTMLIGSVFLILLYLLAYIGAFTFNNPIWQEWAAEATPTMQPFVDMIIEANMYTNMVVVLFASSLTYGVAPLLIVIAAWRTTAVPQWLNWIGLVSGLLGLLWIGWGWLIPPERILIFLPGVFLAYLWQLILAIVMVRYKETAG